MKDKILTLLRQEAGFVSGQELCDHFGVSRTAVWKAINGLKSEGYEIESSPRKGYRLCKVPDVLTEQELKSVMDTAWAGQTIEAHERICYSTNLRAKQLADMGTAHGTLVVADVQAGGKGRRGREWVTTPAGTNIAMSLVLRPDIPPVKASMLTLVAALAVRDGVEKMTGIKPQIKWPNDLVINKKKICGILTEMTMEAEYIQYIILGIGLNVNNESFVGELEDKATSLYLETGKKYGRAELVAASMKAFEHYYEQFVEDLSLKQMVEEYNQSLAGLNQKVCVLEPGKNWEGISRGINEDGELLVEDGEGKVEAVYAGEVSVRGLYGYV